MPNEFQSDVLLSHSSRDKVVVRLAERLQTDGLTVWFDEWMLKPGDSIHAKIHPPPHRSCDGIKERLGHSKCAGFSSLMVA